MIHRLREGEPSTSSLRSNSYSSACDGSLQSQCQSVHDLKSQPRATEEHSGQGGFGPKLSACASGAPLGAPEG